MPLIVSLLFAEDTPLKWHKQHHINSDIRLKIILGDFFLN